MIYELRRYDIRPDAIDGYRSWARDHALPLFERFGFRTLGFFEVLPLEGREPDAYNPTVGVRWLLGWTSIEERDQRWVELAASDAFAALVAKARDDDGNGLFHLGAEMVLLEAWPSWDLQQAAQASPREPPL